MKGRALRRALASPDVVRMAGAVTLPLLRDTTELVTPELAREMLQRNQHNRPINWRKVEEYAEIMRRGDWLLHSQGIILDTGNNILTGQKRLWAVVYSGVSVYMRISRGNPPNTARLLDRGTPQTARDLASRQTGRRHSPFEISIARAIWAARGITHPTTDELATVIETSASTMQMLLEETSKTKKTREVLMILAALSLLGVERASKKVGGIVQLAQALASALLPYEAAKVWNKGAAFGMAMTKAQQIVAVGD